MPARSFDADTQRPDRATRSTRVHLAHVGRMRRIDAYRANT
jgi:hypothetical protein